MESVPTLICCFSPFITVLLIVVPIFIAKINHLSPEHREYRTRVKGIDDEYRKAVAEYNRLKQRDQVNSLAGLRRMKPINFERHVAYIFQKMGYKAVATGRTGDGGIDVEARRDGQFVVIQCKRYAESNYVGSPEVRNFIGAMAVNDADYGYFVTTSSFTRPALQEAARMKNLTLVDGRGIIEWWQEYGVGPFRDLTAPQKRPYPPEPTPLPPLKVLGFLVWQWVTLVALGQVAVFVFIFLIVALTNV